MMFVLLRFRRKFGLFFWGTIISIGLPVSSSVFAETRNAIAVQSEGAPIDIAPLSSSDFWHKLIHYKKANRLFNKSRVQSAVTTDSFFLSPQGMLDPQAELVATINAMRAPVVGKTDDHAQCRFPARYLWLKSKSSSFADSVPRVDCVGFQRWSSNNEIQSISLFFATGYLGNPASYYGHILMRFNDANDRPTGLLATSLDYGAIINSEDNAFVYIAKGLFGGYKAGFTHDQFYKQNHNYGENQLRDLWEYRLNLDEPQTNFIVAHSWELLRNKFVYYFLRNNCAYAMSELVELVIDQPLFDRKVPWVAPHTVFRRAYDASNHGGPLVSQVTLHGSLQSRLYQQFDILNKKERQFVRGFIDKRKAISDAVAHSNIRNDANNINSFNDQAYKLAALDSKAHILEVLLSYYQYRIVADPDNKSHKLCKQQVLIERLRLPPDNIAKQSSEKNKVREKASSLPPHLGQPPITLRGSVVYNSEFAKGLNIRFRPAYFDTLSSDIGRPANSTLAMGNVEFAWFEGFMRLKRFDVIDLEAMNTSVTGLPGDGSYLWKLNIGTRMQNLACKSCLTTGIEGGLGKSYRISHWGEYLFAVDARLQTSYKKSGALALTPRMGFVSTSNEYGKTLVSLGYREFVASSTQDDWVIKLEHRIGDGRDWDFRFSYEFDRENQVGLAISRYW